MAVSSEPDQASASGGSDVYGRHHLPCLGATIAAAQMNGNRPSSEKTVHLGQSRSRNFDESNG